MNAFPIDVRAARALLQRPAATLRRRELLLAAFAIAALADPAWSGQAAHSPLDWARLLLQQVAGDSTSYEHGHGRVQWASSSEPAYSHTDCSGLVNAVLERSFGWGAQDLKLRFGKKRPVASTYFDAIVAGRGFERIDRPENVRPGDLIAMRYPDGSPDSGHIMIADAPPRPSEGTAGDGARSRQWIVRVIDSSRSGHGPNDTRVIARGRFREGLGSGEFRLFADGAGLISGYSWSSTPKSAFFASNDRPIAIGRLRPPEAATR